MLYEDEYGVYFFWLMLFVHTLKPTIISVIGLRKLHIWYTTIVNEKGVMRHSSFHVMERLNLGQLLHRDKLIIS